MTIEIKKPANYYCEKHKIKKRTFFEWDIWIGKEIKKGAKQAQCKECGKWLFPEEI